MTFRLAFCSHLNPRRRRSLHAASRSNYSMITCDKDFGDLAFRERRPYGGVVLLRLATAGNQTRFAGPP